MDDKNLIKAFPNAFGSEGMSLRDYFAAAALQGILAESDVQVEVACEIAYALADEMLKARKQ